MYKRSYDEIISEYLLEKITEEVSIIQASGKRYILKKNVLPVDYEKEKVKCNYIQYLYLHGIKAARIKSLLFENGIWYEIQEYIESSKEAEIDYKNMIITLAKYHKVSSEYNNEYNDNEYEIPYTCYGIDLNRILLGFEEKYYLYSKKAYEAIDTKDSRIKKLFLSYEKVFYELNNLDNIPRIICHNDMTHENLIFTGDDIYIIDFDFGIKTLPYVDFVDIILSRNYELKDIVENYEKIKVFISELVETYNKIYNILNVEDALKMMKVKIISFFFYVHYNKSNMNIFMDNLDNLCRLIDKK